MVKIYTNQNKNHKNGHNNIANDWDRYSPKKKKKALFLAVSVFVSGEDVFAESLTHALNAVFMRCCENEYSGVRWECVKVLCGCEEHSGVRKPRYISSHREN